MAQTDRQTDGQTDRNVCVHVLDAVQFLHHRGIVHLNIAPDNVIMQSRRRFDVKLVDFGLAHKITTVDGVPLDRTGSPEFMGSVLLLLSPCIHPVTHEETVILEENVV